MSKINNNSNKVLRYVVLFKGYGESEEQMDNFSSYSTKLDNISNMTKAKSQAIAASFSHNGEIFADYGEGLVALEKPKVKR
jgi:hypothetical protein